MSAGASYSGARTLVTMKQVGLNVASDPLMSLAYVGVKGGMVIVSAEYEDGGTLEITLVFENGFDLLIPFSMTQYRGEALSATAIPRISRLARSFLSKFEADPFSDEALDWLWSRIAPKQDEWGYRGGKFRWRRCRIFRCTSLDKLSSHLPETVLLESTDGLLNRTTYSLADTLDAGCLCAATCLDGEVLSVAVTHDDVTSLDRGDVIELGVETAPAATPAYSLTSFDARYSGVISKPKASLTNIVIPATAMKSTNTRNSIPMMTCFFDESEQSGGQIIGRLAAGRIEARRSCSFLPTTLYSLRERKRIPSSTTFLPIPSRSISRAR